MWRFFDWFVFFAMSMGRHGAYKKAFLTTILLPVGYMSSAVFFSFVYLYPVLTIHTLSPSGFITFDFWGWSPIYVHYLMLDRTARA